VSIGDPVAITAKLGGISLEAVVQVDDGRKEEAEKILNISDARGWSMGATQLRPNFEVWR
jgi:hypothetical protein